MTRAALIDDVRHLRLSESPDAPPAPDAVVVEITTCGICATDTHAWAAGPGALPPAVFGHEWTGVVSDVGSAVEGFVPGQRVAAAVGPACGTCPQCTAGHTDHCDLVFAEANGVSPGSGDHGGFATSVTVAARRLIALPDDVSDEAAAFLEPTAVTFHAVRRTAFALGATVVVQGAGPIGLLTAMHARSAGAGRVLVVEPSPARRQVAVDLGFSDVVAPGEEFETLLAQRTNGLGADVLFECTGAAALLAASGNHVRRGGTLSLLGFTMAPSSVVYGEWQVRELRVVGSLAYSRTDFDGSLRALASGAVRTDGLHTGTVGLGQLQETLELLDSGTSSHAKVLVDPRR
jgi:(R,R)-butanediol dehydrogenase / meso-butanediol dehydrogenase / diacetyl reductase